MSRVSALRCFFVCSACALATRWLAAVSISFANWTLIATPRAKLDHTAHDNLRGQSHLLRMQASASAVVPSDGLSRLNMKRNKIKAKNRKGIYEVDFRIGKKRYRELFERTLPKDEWTSFGAVRLSIELENSMDVGESWNFDGRLEVNRVYKRSAADSAGIFKGDIIRAVSTFAEQGAVLPWMRPGPPRKTACRLEYVDNMSLTRFIAAVEANSAAFGGDGTAVFLIERPFERPDDKKPGNPWDNFLDDDNSGFGGGPDAGARDLTPAWMQG